VQIYIHIKKEFVPLVRKNTKFWCAGGINVSLSLLGGADISAQSFKTLVGGGIAFATPNEMQELAPNGTTFRLYDKPEEQWQNWDPAIPLPPNRGLDATNYVIQ
jgi:paraquat-inducible protein B